MEIKQATAEKDPNTGRNKILVEIDANDIKIINDGIAFIEENGKYDKDDKNYKDKLEHVKEMSHKTWTLLWPS